MVHAAHPGNPLLSSGGRRFPPGRHRSALQGILRRQQVGFERYDDIDLPCAFQFCKRCPVEKSTIFEQEIARA